MKDVNVISIIKSLKRPSARDYYYLELELADNGLPPAKASAVVWIYPPLGKTNTHYVVDAFNFHQVNQVINYLYNIPQVLRCEDIGLANATLSAPENNISNAEDLQSAYYQGTICLEAHTEQIIVKNEKLAGLCMLGKGLVVTSMVLGVGYMFYSPSADMALSPDHATTGPAVAENALPTATASSATITSLAKYVGLPVAGVGLIAAFAPSIVGMLQGKPAQGTYHQGQGSKASNSYLAPATIGIAAVLLMGGGLLVNYMATPKKHKKTN
jgi:hypothetical protein